MTLFYHQLQYIRDNIPHKDQLIGMMNLNARLGNNINAVIKYKFNERNINGNGDFDRDLHRIRIMDEQPIL